MKLQVDLITPFVHNDNLHILTKDGSIFIEDWALNEYTKLKDWKEEISDKDVDFYYKILHLKQN